jgi:hypothetical protein
VLIANLPPTSATHLALTEGKSGWGTTDHLLAAVVDLLNAGNWQRGGGKGRRPKPVGRPGANEPDKERLGGKTSYTTAEMRALLAANRE